jgi:hypothetical protein
MANWHQLAPMLFPKATIVPGTRVAFDVVRPIKLIWPADFDHCAAGSKMFGMLGAGSKQ